MLKPTILFTPSIGLCYYFHCLRLADNINNISEINSIAFIDCYMFSAKVSCLFSVSLGYINILIHGPHAVDNGVIFWVMVSRNIIC